MFSRFLVYLFIVLVSGAAGAGFWHVFHTNRQSPPLGRAVSDFALIDRAGNFHQLTDYSDRKAIVLYSHNPECSSGKQGISALRSVRQQFTTDAAAVLAIQTTPAKSDSETASASMPTDSAAIPVLMDDSLLITESLGILRSGEVLVVDPSTWTVRYRGPIDNRSDYESENVSISKYYLADAIRAVLNGDPIEITERASTGCPIDSGRLAGNDSISYRDAIVPILKERCLACHQKGGIGPWAMDGHATLKAWAARMREVILLKMMPPWHADPAVGEFAHSLALDTAQKRALIHWIDAGAPRGEGPDPLATVTPPAPAEWPLGEPDIVLKVPTFKIPATGVLAWQYIKLPVPIERDTWVRAVHMNPSNREATHHIFAFVEYPEERKHEEPKWAEGANGFFAAYVPGYPVVPYPDDSGRLLPKGSKIIFQRHYLTIGHPTEDDLQLGLYLHEDPPAMEFKMATAINLGIRIPPGSPAHRETASLVFPEDGFLHAIYPHMHYRGSSVRLSASYPDGREEALLSVPNYHFQWQNSYQLKDPKPIPAGTRVLLDAVFDNSAKNPLNPDPSQEVRWGQLSENEMLVAYLMYTAKRKTQDIAGTGAPQPGFLGKR